MVRLKKILGIQALDFAPLKNRTLFLWLFLISFFIRFPFFFRDYIDRDESTFILMGQSWVNGHLPYTELWDLKPPLVFLFFAGIIYVFGKSFIAIRLAGVIVVAVTSYVTYAMVRDLDSKKLGFWAAVACVYLLSLFGSLQGVMSEHLSMLYFMPALYLMMKSRKPQHLFLSGLLMGLALMTKLNLAYAVMLLGLFLVLDGFRQRQYKKTLAEALSFGLGVLLVIMAAWLMYAMKGNSQLWWNSVVLAPLEYTSVRRDPIYKLAPVVLIPALFLYLSARRKWLRLQDRSIQLLAIAVMGVALSFLKGGRINGHYLIQFHPIFLVLLALVLHSALPPLASKWRYFVLTLLLLAPLESYNEYVAVARYKIARGHFFNGEGFTVPAYLREHRMDKEDVFFLEYHIAYWLLNKQPPTRAATHPSNICRDELFPFYGNPRKTSIEELAYIMEDLRPALVITRANKRIFDKKEVSENLYMTAYLQQHYKVIARVDNAEIRRRLK